MSALFGWILLGMFLAVPALSVVMILWRTLLYYTGHGPASDRTNARDVMIVLMGLLAAYLFLGCERPPRWVLWSDSGPGYEAQSEHQTLAACQEAAKIVAASRKTACLRASSHELVPLPVGS